MRVHHNFDQILQGRRGHIDFYVRVIRVRLNINRVTRQKSQYASVGPTVLTLLFGDRKFDKIIVKMKKEFSMAY